MKKTVQEELIALKNNRKHMAALTVFAVSLLCVTCLRGTGVASASDNIRIINKAEPATMSAGIYSIAVTDVNVISFEKNWAVVEVMGRSYACTITSKEYSALKKAEHHQFRLTIPENSLPILKIK